MKKAVRFSFTIAILTGLFLLNDDGPVLAQTLPKSSTSEGQVSISASIGEPILKLWGYGSPNSKMELTGNKVSDFTFSKEDGYFEFPRTFLPAPSGDVYPELCVTAIDSVGRITPPTCIPELPVNQNSYDIGPIILPPTLSLEEGSVTAKTQAGASGITIPNSDVRIVMAESASSGNLVNFSIVKPALAYYIPNYTVKSDNHGNFSFNMPGVSPDGWHVFAITNYSQGSSPKSNTLKFVIISGTQGALQNFWAFILSLFTLPALIILEIITVILISIIILLRRMNALVKT